VGGGGNDIQWVQSRYDTDLNEIVVTLQLCSDASRDAAYRVHLDHAAPFVGEADAPPPAPRPRTAWSRRPDGHKGVGTSEVEGNLVRLPLVLGV
jgi:hypothetical protein